ncbi:MAG: hypothetical protein EPN85_11810 [Bacteroidetes bacterium]|nr:MAG: hypothetical protein EPN85_11810 [Bacteroidota bacterium]
MTASDDLFRLIRALTKSERRYFKLFSSIYSGDKTYIALFDAIAKQKTYDEKRLLKQFEGYKLVKQFSVAKYYLYHQVLKAMCGFHSNEQTEVYRMLQQSDFLYNKNLYKQADKTLLKAKTLALQYEMYPSLLDISSVEHRLALRKDNIHEIENIPQQEAAYLRKMQANIKNRDFHSQMTVLYNRYGNVREKKYLQQLEKLVQKNRSNLEEKNLFSFKSTLRFHAAFLLYFHVKGNHLKAYDHSKKIIELFQKSPHVIKQNINSYLEHLHNTILIAFESKSYDEGFLLLEQMKEVSDIAKTRLQKATWFYSYYHLLLNYYVHRGYFTEAMAQMPSLEKELKEFIDELNNIQKIALYYNIALIYFGCGNIRRTLSWLNIIRNELFFVTHPEMECSLSIFYLIAHYESDHTDLLPNLIKLFYRFLSKKKRIFKYETLLIEFFRKDLGKADSQKKLINAFQSLKERMEILAEDPFEKNAFEYFDLISWLDSKIQNRSFAEVVREKAITVL